MHRDYARVDSERRRSRRYACPVSAKALKATSIEHSVRVKVLYPTVSRILSHTL
ncbi:MAG: hypothetical protein ACOXZM_06080 [Eubacteriales bacterium]